MSKSDEPYVAKKLLISHEQFFVEIDSLLDRMDGLVGHNADAVEFKSWRKAAQDLLNHALGEKSQQACEFGWISFEPLSFVAVENDLDWGVGESGRASQEYFDGLNSAKLHLQSIRDEVDKYFPKALDKEHQTSKKGIRGGRSVFIVHGHDKELLAQVENAVHCLGLTPIVLSKQPNAGKTLIQKFEANSNDVCFAIFLLTDDESVTVHSTGMKEEHARQNVIFEMGYFFNAFRMDDGSHCGIFAILENGVTKPGDVDGLVYHPYAKGDMSWKLALVKELSAAHVDFDKEGIARL